MTLSHQSQEADRKSVPAPFVITALVIVSIVLAMAPLFVEEANLRTMIEIFAIFAFAQSWNLLAGYAGLMSFGQHLFIGLGGYFVFVVSNATGINPFILLPLSFVFTGLAAALITPMIFRLRDAYFAIGLWVLAEVVRLFTIQTEWLGSVSGMSLYATRGMDRAAVANGLYWASLAIAVVSVLGFYFFMLRKTGFALMAVRDNEQAAKAVGINVWRVRFVGFVVAAGMCGITGGVFYMSVFYIDPGSAYDANWIVVMLFVAIIGGIGTIEGPILGTLIYFLLRSIFGETGYVYQMLLGAAAVATMLFAPKGVWGLISNWTKWELLSTRRQ